jgi:hypothetical protein
MPVIPPLPGLGRRMLSSRQPGLSSEFQSLSYLKKKKKKKRLATGEVEIYND